MGRIPISDHVGKTPNMVVLLGVVLSFSRLEVAQDNFPDIPPFKVLLHQALRVAGKHGLLEDDRPMGALGDETWATELLRIERRLHAKEVQLREISDSLATDHPGSESAKRDYRRAEKLRGEVVGADMEILMKAFQWGSKEFARQIIAVGGTPTELNIQVAQYRTFYANWKLPVAGFALIPFADVPHSHWGAASVQSLKTLGMIHGNPDGSFSGSGP